MDHTTKAQTLVHGDFATLQGEFTKVPNHAVVAGSLGVSALSEETRALRLSEWTCPRRVATGGPAQAPPGSRRLSHRHCRVSSEAQRLCRNLMAVKSTNPRNQKEEQGRGPLPLFPPVA